MCLSTSDRDVCCLEKMLLIILQILSILQPAVSEWVEIPQTTKPNFSQDTGFSITQYKVITVFTITNVFCRFILV